MLSRAEFDGGFAVARHSEQKGTLQSRTAAQHRPLGRSALSDRGRSERRAVKATFVVVQAHEGHAARRVPGAGGHSGRVGGSAVGWWARCGVTGLTLLPPSDGCAGRAVGRESHGGAAAGEAGR